MEMLDYLIVGAGPAGLQIGYYLQQSGENYLILERSDTAGSFFQQFPRHRKLISINKVYSGHDDDEIKLRWDWNSLISHDPNLVFTKYTNEYFPDAETMFRYLNDYKEKFDLNIHFNTSVKHIEKKDEHFKVTTEDGKEYHCKVLLIASGLSKPYMPPIPGIELTENYFDVSVNPEEFINQHVLIIGKGNSGFETAENLIETTAQIHIISPNPLKFAWKTHHVGHLRAVNNNFLDTYQLKNQNAVLDATIKNIKREKDKFVVTVAYSHAENETEDLYYDRIINCTGFCFDFSIFDKNCMPEKTIHDRFPKLTSEWESTNIKNIYFIGVIMQMRDFKKLNSGFIHGFRYTLLSLYRMMKLKYNHQPWPHNEFEATPENLTTATINRVNHSSGLWLLNGFLCDTIAISGKRAYYLEELPLDYVNDSQLSDQNEFFTISLEFGKIENDPFNIPRYPDPTKAEKSTFLHPVIRCFRDKKLVAEQHLLEDLAGEWKKEVHLKPLLEFYQQNL